MDKKSKNFTLDKIKQTYQATELTDGKNDDKKAKLDFLK